MKVAIIGATGFVGKAITKQASDRGLDVIALARDISKVQPLNGVKAISVDVFEKDPLVEALRGHSVVISAYNPGWDNPNIYDDFIKGATLIQAATQAAAVKRFIVIGGAGSLFIAGRQLVDGPQFPKAWKAGATAARDYLAYLREEKTLDWTFVSPAIELVPGPRTGKYRLGLESPVFDQAGQSKISVGDLASAVLDEVQKPRHIQKRFTLGY